MSRLIAGIGCDRGVRLETLERALREALQRCGARLDQVQGLSSIDLKQDEAALLALARQHGWPLQFFPATQLARVTVPNPSETVRRYTGTPAVAEAAALLAAQAGLDDLLIEKHKCRGIDGKNATVSLVRIPTPTDSGIPSHD